MTSPHRTQMRLPARGSVYWYYSSNNDSPRVTDAFLAAQRKLLLPQQYAREHENAWIDAADSFTTAGDVDAAMGTGWTEGRVGDPTMGGYVSFIDLGAVHDPTVIAIGHLDEQDRAVIDKILTFQGDKAHPVQLVRVEAVLVCDVQANC